MKNRKRIIATLACMSLTFQMLPSAYTIVANAQTTNTDEQQQTTGLDTKVKKRLDTNVIKLYGVGCQEKAGEIGKSQRDHEFEIKFNTDNMKLEANAITGYPGDDEHGYHPYYNGNYITVTLLTKAGQVKKTVSLAGHENIEKLQDELNTWKFNYGDRIRIYHAEGDGRCKIVDKAGKPLIDINKNILNTYDFQITGSGLKEVEQTVTVKKVGDESELRDALKELKGLKGTQGIIKLKNNIKISKADPLEVPQGVSIQGNKHEIDLGGEASLVLKGNFTGLSSLTIKNSVKEGVQIYNSGYSYLQNVTVQDSNGYGLFVNGSYVILDNCTTKNNKDGGVMICKSMFLEKAAKKAGKSITSNVEVVGGLKSEEKEDKSDVVVKNLSIKDNVKVPGAQQGSFKRYLGNYFGGQEAQEYTETTKEISTKLNKSYYDNDLGLNEKTIVLETYKEYKLNK